MVLDLTTSREGGGERAVGRDEQFRELYMREYPPLAGYVQRLVGDRELAHDLAQESFTRVFGRLLQVDDPRAYLYGVATNLVRRAWRQRARQREAVLGLASQPSAAAVAADASYELREAVGRLPHKLRDVVLLHYWADLTVADVAAALNRPVGTVKRQLSEARTHLVLAVTRD